MRIVDVGVGIDSMITGRTTLYEDPVESSLGAEGASEGFQDRKATTLSVNITW